MNSPNADHFYSDAGLEKIIADLGITIWRNEVYPHNPLSENNTPNQDPHLEVQRPMVQALQAKADEHNVDLKIILTAWSPPGEFKWNAIDYGWAGDENAQRYGQSCYAPSNDDGFQIV